MIADAEAARTRQAEEVKRHQEAAEAAKAQQFIFHLQQYWKEYAPTLLAALQPRIFYRPQSSQTAISEFELDGQTWTVTGGGGNYLSVTAPDHETAQVYGREQMQESLLLQFADYRARVANRKAIRAMEERVREEQAALLRAEHEAREQEDAVSRQIMASAIAASPLWLWPDGVAVVAFRWSWQIGASANGEVEHDGGWSLVDRLDVDGYVRLMPERWLRERTLRLDMLAHRPVVERVVWSGLANLSEDLIERVEIAVPGVRVMEWSNNEPRWFARNPGSNYPLLLGHQPVAWVRQLVDGARNSR